MLQTPDRDESPRYWTWPLDGQVRVDMLQTPDRDKSPRYLRATSRSDASPLRLQTPDRDKSPRYALPLPLHDKGFHNHMRENPTFCCKYTIQEDAMQFTSKPFMLHRSAERVCSLLPPRCLSQNEALV